MTALLPAPKNRNKLRGRYLGLQGGPRSGTRGLEVRGEALSGLQAGRAQTLVHHRTPGLGRAPALRWGPLGRLFLRGLAQCRRRSGSRASVSPAGQPRSGKPEWCSRASPHPGRNRGDRKEEAPRGAETRATRADSARIPRQGGAVAQEPSLPPARACPRARARPMLPTTVCQPTPTPTGLSISPGAERPKETRRSLPPSRERERALGCVCIVMRGGEGRRGRGGLAPARAGTHRGGRRDCEVALTHVPGFLSGQGGYGDCDGGGGGDRREGWWGRSRCPLAQSRCPSLTDSPSFHHGRATPAPAAS